MNVPSSRYIQWDHHPRRPTQTITWMILMITLLLVIPTLNCYKIDPKTVAPTSSTTSSPARHHPNDHGPDSLHPDDDGDPSPAPVHHVSLVGWRFDEVQPYLVVALFLLAAGLLKIIYHHMTNLHSYIPESCVLIIVGTCVGFLYKSIGYNELLPFRSEHFFFLLLPPIILESAYELHDKSFFHNIKTILLYAVVGTVMNVLLIGGSLIGAERSGFFSQSIPAMECITFAIIISAVDPVAVLAIFHEIGVNKPLYFLVFGESLLNDAVVITMYNTVTTFASLHQVTMQDWVIGFCSFFTVSGGGFLVGLLIGFATSFTTRTSKTVEVVNPLIVIALAYTSYVAAELFHFSGIISLITCGLVQYQYVGNNISPESMMTIKYFTKTSSSIADVIIFFYLGRVLVRDDHTWDTKFVTFSVAIILIFRFLSVFTLTAFANAFLQPLRRISLGEQFIMAYGGLRGAIAFSLSVSLDGAIITQKNLFITTTLFIILFTVFFLGSTTKPIIKLLGVELQSSTKDELMFTAVNNRLMDTIMSGVEEVTGAHSVHSFTMKFRRFNDSILKPLLNGPDDEDKHQFQQRYNQVKRKTIRRSLAYETRIEMVRSKSVPSKSSEGSIDVSSIEQSSKEPDSPPVLSPPIIRSGRDPSTHVMKKAATLHFGMTPNENPYLTSYTTNTSKERPTTHVPNGESTSGTPDDQVHVNRRRNTMFSRPNRNLNTLFDSNEFYHLPQRGLLFTSSMSRGRSSDDESGRRSFNRNQRRITSERPPSPSSPSSTSQSHQR